MALTQFLFFSTILILNIWCSNNEFLKKPFYDVLIIGAGASGLSAANDLQTKGKNVLILEGRNRIGGRIHTDFDRFGDLIDIGAIHITYYNDSPILELAKKIILL